MDDHLAWLAGIPWYRRPAAAWLLPVVLILATAGGLCMAPKQEILTQLVCHELGLDGRGDMSPSPNVLQHLSLVELVSTAPLNSSAHCRTIPAVQSGLSALQLRMDLAMGIAAVITTGFWGSLSDRFGRTLVLRLGVLGFLASDLCFISVARLPLEQVPLGSNFLVVGALVFGIFGGFATLAAACQAYIADTTPSGSKSRALSVFGGLMFLGFGLGPLLGGNISTHSNNLVLPFYVALGAHVLYALLAFAVLPESVSKARMELAQKEFRRLVEQADADEGRAGAHDRYVAHQTTRACGPLGGARRRLNRVVATAIPIFLMPFQPLALLAPKMRLVLDEPPRTEWTPRESRLHPEASASHISVSRIRQSKRDWNLTLLSAGYFLEASVIGILSPKISYAQYRFDWAPAQLGAYISFGAICRVVALIAIIPLLIKLVHRPKRSIALPHDHVNAVQVLDAEGRILDVQDERDSDRAVGDDAAAEDRHADLPANFAEATGMGTAEPQLGAHGAGATGSGASHSVEDLWLLRAKHIRLLHDSRFDRRLALFSICLYLAGYVGIVFTAGQGPIPFLISNAVTSLGGAAPAAMSSLALALLERETDSGKLFAAWAVLSAIATTVVGPTVFISVYERTTNTYPEAMFVLAMGVFTVAFVFVALVRLRRSHSLPSLPARPHTTASRAAALAAKRKSVESLNANAQDGAQYGSTRSASSSEAGNTSTRSKWRMRPLSPWQARNDDAER
ncbi:hypothetical protein IE81DRAFT_320235 [Ceraceosorus guamensis]|uniref:MFS general substrate transporter n=1 Tax=Ceraceosorus guamensis TaxID=1522189 RepID=A0A316W9Q1_9BASI|nr:hypothetical protein IE81DRAFT_320235 [Ceraceosorus guamensis]PWN45471.1 hypothetical protein IE81DRAFT_320235 [Ceraceosorus guamensis]